MGKEEKDEAYKLINTSAEYWIPCIVRGDEGEVDAPKLRILAGKKTVYQRVQNLMLDDDLGEDITDPLEGRDLLIKRTGRGIDNECSRNALLDHLPSGKSGSLEDRTRFVHPDHGNLAVPEG